MLMERLALVEAFLIIWFPYLPRFFFLFLLCSQVHPDVFVDSKGLFTYYGFLGWQLITILTWFTCAGTHKIFWMKRTDPAQIYKGSYAAIKTRWLIVASIFMNKLWFHWTHATWDKREATSIWKLIELLFWYHQFSKELRIEIRITKDTEQE